MTQLKNSSKVEAKQIPLLPENKPSSKGIRCQLDAKTRDTSHLEQFYRHPNGEIWVGDAKEWLKSLKNESVDLIFADPPYNIKKAEWDTFESQEAYIKWSLAWIEEAARVLKPQGTLLYLWLLRNTCRP